MTEQTPSTAVLHALTMLVLVIHIAGGAIGLVSGTVAVIAGKGGYLHRRAGGVFVGSMIRVRVTRGAVATGLSV